MSDSFTEQVQRIIILKDGIPKADNIYKRKNLLDGPFWPKLFTAPPKLAVQNLLESPAVIVNPPGTTGTSDTHNNNSNGSGVGENELASLLVRPAPANAVAGPSNTTHSNEMPTHHVDDEVTSEKLASTNSAVTAKKTKAKSGKEKHTN
jgi:hypothetical protein